MSLATLRASRHARRSLPTAAPVSDINTTPLIDVMLVLLVMLIITIPIQLHSVNLNLPVGAPPPPPEQPPQVVRIDIDATSTAHWNGTPLASLAELQQQLATAAALPVPPELHVRPDARARYDRFAEVMVAVHQAGLVKVGVVGSEQFEDR
ncbi:MAG: biopolymer transporter ExbD [Rubrivivax sp.]|jgi:biopolymer transport protein ExbD|nr:biopolymer transporter ExbD [Rubrivivax sp.]